MEPNQRTIEADYRIAQSGQYGLSMVLLCLDSALTNSTVGDVAAGGPLRAFVLQLRLIDAVGPLSPKVR